MMDYTSDMVMSFGRETTLIISMTSHVMIVGFIQMVSKYITLGVIMRDVPNVVGNLSVADVAGNIVMKVAVIGRRMVVINHMLVKYTNDYQKEQLCTSRQWLKFG